MQTHIPLHARTGAGTTRTASASPAQHSPAQRTASPQRNVGATRTMASETLQQKLRRQLLADAAAGTAAFESSGSFALDAPLKLFFEDEAGRPHVLTLPLDDAADLQPLLDACAPASFGVGGQTVRDPKVRNALQMPGSRLSLGGGGGLIVPPAALLAGVQQLMMPQAQPGMVEAQLYSPNVYGPDGFFKAHRDTPRGAEMFGSLVVCLPVEHAGGTLVVRAPNLRGEVRHDWGGSGLLEGAAGRLAWAAFFSDCEHEVLPVTSGHRVTLAFNLRATSAPAGQQGAAAAALALPPAPQPRESAFGQQLAAALHDATWFPGGIKLGLVLEHMYAVEAEPRKAMPSAPITPQQLKGGDLQLYAAARGLGLECRIVAVYQLSLAYMYDEEEEPRGPHADLTYGAFKKKKVLPDPDDLDAMAAVAFPGGFGGEEEVWFIDEESEPDYLHRMRGTEHDPSGEAVVWVKPPGEQHLVYRDAATAFGNDGHTEHWYVAAALMIDVPAADAPSRKPKA